MKICPTCSTEWPDKANFCPKDGSDLVDLPAPAESASPEPAPPEPVLHEPAPPEPAPPEPVNDMPEDMAEQMAQEAAKLREQAQANVELEPREAGGFSETQWFMVAEEPDKLKDGATAGELRDMQDDYDWDEEIPEDVRAKFSLRRKGNKKEE